MPLQAAALSTDIPSTIFLHPFSLSHMPNHLSRRSFVKSVGLTGVGVWTATSGIARAISPNEKLNLAVVGLGRQGCDDLVNMLDENVVAVADADQGYMMRTLTGRVGKHPKAKQLVEKAPFFDDFRVMYDKHEKQIDAVLVATPDHLHFHPAWSAMQRGKHLYQQKPLAHNVWEVRQLTNLAREKKLVTQLGVQRHVNKGLRDGVAIIKSGILGPVKEVYSWMGSGRGGEWTKITEPSTDKLKWDIWLGPSEAVPHRDGLAHYDFRFYWKYGTGDAGNFGCHILDVPYWALDLKYPTKVSVQAGGEKPHAERTPKAMGTTFQFAATDKRPAVTLHWNQGIHANAAKIIKEHKTEAQPLKGVNNIFICEKGTLICGYEDKSPTVVVPNKGTSIEASKNPGAKMFAKSPGFWQEWINACKGDKTAPTCNFDYSGPLTETVLLANVAYRAQATFNWNGEKMEADKPEVTKLLREAYRKGWEI
jgi:predicted dehydrogenase